MNHHPKISVAVPVYNGGDYFRQAVESVLAQTYDNVEIVIVDDGSNDGGETAAIGRRFKGPNVKFIQQKNQGVGGAMNTAIANMTGEIFCWLSHDDLYLPHKIERQVDFYNKMARTNAMLYADYFLIDSDGKEFCEVKMPHEKLRRRPMLALLNGCINGCTLFIPLEILRRFLPFNPALKYAQDYDLWNRVLREYDFFHQPETLIRYRVHPAQDTNKPGAAIEGENIWIKMMDDRTEIERVHMYRSSKMFFSSLAEHLQHSNYHRAIEFANARAEAVVHESLVSIVVPVAAHGPEVDATLDAALSQSHSKIEVLMVGAPVAPLSEQVGRDPRLRLVACEGNEPSALLNLGVTAAAGDYIAIARPGAVRERDSIANQLQQMQERGLVLSCEQDGAVVEVTTQDLLVGNCSASLDRVMLHRVLAIDADCFDACALRLADSAALVPLAHRTELLFPKEA